MPQDPLSQDLSERQSAWQVAPADELTADWITTVAQISGLSHPTRGAQLLWSRQLRSADSLQGFLHAADYAPASPFAFGEEMAWAVDRLVVARDRNETVAIWGDFDADGVTSTAVLWDGFRQFFPGENQLSYFIPNRLKESHGLSISGVEQLAAQGVNLIVTCDTGSTNPLEIEHARGLGMDVIVTDHHTLPAERPDVVAIVNPRALSREHPMADLSGVAVAYKLIEALYEKLPEVPTRSLAELVDLVAIGLIADLVELRGDCRYLAQIGIEQLQTHLRTDQPVRPGVARLLQLCRRAGDRPTDISFGLGPRINAVSRIYGDASFCVELLTSRDPDRCRVLAEKAELANARRKALQNDVFQQVKRQLETRDLSTMGVIVLCDPQWPVGVLGLVAGQVAQQYGKPTILLTVDAAGSASSEPVVSEATVQTETSQQASTDSQPLARGSARSVNQIDLYDLVNSQAHLLQGFGGHPFAAGLSLYLDDLPMFTAAINQQYRQKMGGRLSQPMVKVDLVVTVAELGRDLFQELKLLEPCGMGNPVPKLLIKDAWFEDVWHQKLKDRTGGKVGYIKASFKLCDRSRPQREEGFPGLWWGHYKDDLPPGRWDVVAELDYNSHPRSRQYEIRLIDIRPAVTSADDALADDENGLSPVVADWLLDCRVERPEETLASGETTGVSDEKGADETDLVMGECPTQWKELLLWRYQADRANKPLALAYAPPVEPNPIDKWKTLLGLAKFVSRKQVAVTRERLGEVLGVCDRTLTLGLDAISEAGFTVTTSAIDIRLKYDAAEPPTEELARTEALSHFLSAVQEEHFRRQYFYQAPVATLQAAMSSDVPETF